MQSLWKKDFCGCGGLSVLWEKGSNEVYGKRKKENDRWEVIEIIVGLVTFTILFGVFG